MPSTNTLLLRNVSSWLNVASWCSLSKAKRNVWQAMFERRPNIAWHAKISKICGVMFFIKIQKHFFAWSEQKMLDEQCFWTWPNGQTFCLTNESQMLDQQFLIFWPGLKASKALAKWSSKRIMHVKPRYQAMFEHFTSFWEEISNIFVQCFLKFQKNFRLTKQKTFDSQFFVTWPNVKTLSLTSKFWMFQKQCLIVWQRPKQ